MTARSAGEREDDARVVDGLGFRAFYDATVANVYSFVLGRVAGDVMAAEDVVAETYLHAARRFEVDGQVDIRWLFVVARRRVADYWRDQARIDRRVHRIRSQPNPPQPSLADEEVERWRIVEVLRQLPPDQRGALVMFHVEGFSTSEVADLLDRSYRATESLLGRARKAFRRHYEAYDD